MNPESHHNHPERVKNDHNPVREYYNRHIDDEDKRLKNNEFELPVTFKYIDKYMKPGDKVLDIACGTGRYAQKLLQKGFLLGLNDLSDSNMALTLERLGNHPHILHTEVSDALDAGIWQKEPWDSILLLGPLYHLIEREERLVILRKAAHAVKKGGYVFTAFMSRTSALLYGLKNNPEGILSNRGTSQLWNTGSDNEFIEGTEWFVNAYFSFPEEIEPLVKEAGLNPVHLAGIEGVFGEHMHLYHGLRSDLKKAWMKFIMGHSEDIHMVHTSKHLLSVSQRPE
jgi:S-adenosylmethionine-dependent methyltransferase